MRWKFWEKKSDEFELLSEVLQAQLAKSSLFDSTVYTRDVNSADAKKVVAYSRTSGYDGFAGEAWLEVVAQIKKISTSKDQREIDQAVGALRSTLNLLGVSFRAFKLAKNLAKDPEPTKK